MFDKYLNQVNRLYKSGNATEHSYRPALQECLSGLLKNVHVTNEPKRQRCGAPDFIITRRKIDIGYIEAKDIGVDLDRVERGGKDDDQWKRYTASLDNIILTDYLEFRFFLNGKKVETICIAEQSKKGIVPQPENFDHLQKLIVDFAAYEGQSIKSAKKLAEMMAHKAALMRDVFFLAVNDESGSETSLKDQLKAFQTVLMHDMDEAQFADVYAQTIAYGLFTARLHDEKPKDFSRTEALNLIPKSNPFLRQLFHYIAGPDLDPRVVWIVDALCEVYRAADIHAIMKDFGIATGKNDPILHFYETFLEEYNPALREKRGVYYTPEPVVHFIVRAIDDCLKTHFDLKDGLANTSMVQIEIDGQEKTKAGKPVKIKKQVHKVQLLDVATGTGTFLADIVKRIYAGFKGQEGAWSGYVEQHLLPRMQGFELLMAPYAMCHMKLDLLLKETGYEPSKPDSPPRLGVYLTNSLEEYHPDTDTLFAQWLSKEANEASRIKKDMPIMVALGNPPYSGISSNMSSWIARTKIEDYKYVNGVHFGERKHWLNDDYVQFIRLGEYYIEKNGEGILAYITNHGYLDNPTFRGMRWHLLNTFDDIYILDLHGNTKKKETAPDGSLDKNVFDIQQGVAILVAIKRQRQIKNKPLAKIHHADLWGTREKKYEALDEGSLVSIRYNQLDVREPFYFFVPKNYIADAEYQAGFALDNLFLVNSVGVVTARDGFCIDLDRPELEKRIRDFCNEKISNQELETRYNLKDTSTFNLQGSRNFFFVRHDGDDYKPIAYRPFDERQIFYHDKIVERPLLKVMRHFLKGDNLGLMVSKQQKTSGFRHVLCHRGIVESSYVSNKTSEIGYTFPLYLYEDNLGHTETKRSNFDLNTYKLIQKIIPDVQPQSLFDYIYAVLHSRAYRQRYAEFLKSNFPRIPYPKDPKTFHALAAKGAELRGLHLMESPLLDKLITAYPVTGNHEIVALRWEDTKGKPGLGRVWINSTQYFDKVPLTVWDFYIGGYQPAQKWLKDRKGRKLTSDDLRHWQRIIVALTETDRIMHDIDRIDFLPE